MRGAPDASSFFIAETQPTISEKDIWNPFLDGLAKKMDKENDLAEAFKMVADEMSPKIAKTGDSSLSSGGKGEEHTKEDSATQNANNDSVTQEETNNAKQQNIQNTQYRQNSSGQGNYYYPLPFWWGGGFGGAW